VRQPSDPNVALLNHSGWFVVAITKSKTGLGAGLGPGFVHAEGAGKFSPADKGSFYTQAQGSAESAAVLDLCRKLKLVDGAKTDENTALLKAGNAKVFGSTS